MIYLINKAISQQRIILDFPAVQAAGPVRRSSAGNLPYSRGDPAGTWQGEWSKKIEGCP